MKIAGTELVLGTALVVAVLGLTACGTRTTVFMPPSSASASATGPSAAAVAKVATPATPATTITKTVIKYREVRVTPSAAAPVISVAPAVAPAAAPPVSVPNVTDPWAVVSAYYGDLESGNYWEAWQLLDSGMTTGQTYQQFVDGFACTGSQNLTENWESGDEVNFNLAATDACTGVEQYFAGTDTVADGKIVGASVAQTG